MAGPNGFCFSHDPDNAQARSEARRRGGYNRRAIRRLKSLVPEGLMPVLELLDRALVDVQTGVLEPARANAMATLVRAQVAIVQTGSVARRQAILDGDDVIEIQLKWPD